MKSVGCAVRIVTRSEGDERTFMSAGTLEYGVGVFTVRYTEEGDEVTLDYGERTLQMDRRGGGGNLSARFCRGERTQFLLFFGSYRGVLSVFTKTLQLSMFPGKIFCTLSYVLGGDPDVPAGALPANRASAEEGGKTPSASGSVAFDLQISITFPEEE